MVQSFLTTVREVAPDTAGYSDDQILGFGQVACHYLSNGTDFETILNSITHSNAGLSHSDAGAVIAAAEDDLCRQYSGIAPSRSDSGTRPPRPQPAEQPSVEVGSQSMPGPSPGRITASRASLFCKVEIDAANGQETFEVDGGASGYTGPAKVTFYLQGENVTFPAGPTVTVHPSGSMANWHRVPNSDIGASAEPNSCSAMATG